MSEIKLATSLFSYAIEWQSRTWTLEDLLARTREIALGPGLEIIGFQTLRGFPRITDAQVAEVRGLMEKYAFEPVCLGANVDVRLRRDRLMTADETVAYLIPQVEVAARLGFPVLRVQMTAGPEVYRKLVPTAERLGVRLGIELHTPYGVDHPRVLAMRALVEELDTPYLGFIPDFGTSMRSLPTALLDSFRAVGVSEEVLAITREVWALDAPAPERFARLRERASAVGATPQQLGRLNMALSMCGRQPPEQWAEIVPRTVHLHGKFYGFDADGREPSFDHETILRVFLDGGYRGYISSEYEGTAFTDAYSGFEMVRRHHELLHSILQTLEQR
ncbi:hypothetical protein GQ464_000170 [Rhodocaloribacter litoris]|uniref:sugar phosphate isomerase/epimerase family protein n=1 Tax=Rhodocaloribacter litoris TaxID=2558931 RepID=UPI00141DEF01|nr:TIM barrel protein [Rhodocaloribacter litoris]QXD15410.1 hypothetical protein GQ464_000170 [Rhodocaloribacter litoris]